jgi:hypothetical protein
MLSCPQQLSPWLGSDWINNDIFLLLKDFFASNAVNTATESLPRHGEPSIWPDTTPSFEIFAALDLFAGMLMRKSFIKIYHENVSYTLDERPESH